MPLVSSGVPPLLLYLAIGSAGALFTLSLLLLPRIPAVFALAIIGQNVFQSAAFVVEKTIIFRTIGDDNPLASTQFGLLAGGDRVPDHLHAGDRRAGLPCRRPDRRARHRRRAVAARLRRAASACAALAPA